MSAVHCGDSSSAVWRQGLDGLDMCRAANVDILDKVKYGAARQAGERKPTEELYECNEGEHAAVRG